ncbi:MULTISPECIES: hypothetical protein [unclassified Methylobacterium]|jgi:hypothetical protein|uniref:hypothetical protein n=1 Tax=unclassified Methylobacterium TaxID=2615210 RepID=UPI0006F34343|nr:MULTISPECIES: hypothetical protein [unclassified Methylobacterium]KQO53695.1 hypothetical protein ASF24_04995 [Methylobacterium sp. Leaf86]KQO99227.1 hypothetical protein ASF32_15370 [Methylobacterium sp. Leaf91]MBO1022153.1 hypothetical protein [Methylobacterium sp. SD274]
MHDQRLVSEEQVLVERDQTVREGADVEGTRHARTRKVVVGLTGLLGAAWAVVLASRFTTFSF